MITLIEIIQHLVPNAVLTVYGEPSSESEYLNNVIWQDERDQPSWEEVINAHDSALNAIYFKNLRIQRNILLAACDWTQVEDVSVDKTAWAEYRQALRDLPANTTDPENPVWPTPPE